MTPQERNEELFGTSTPLCFVTGSLAPRVGQAVAQLFHAQSFEAVLHGRAQPDSAKPLPDFASMVVYGAVEQEENVQRWLEQIQERFGRIDCVVNSAAIWDPLRLEQTKAEDFKRYFEVNTLGSALLCRHFGLAMTKQATGGAIVNIGDWAVRRPYRDFPAYFVSKGAIQSLTETMAIELAARNPKVRVSAVHPGPVLMDQRVSDEREREIAEQSLLKRPGRARDVAEAVYFLAMSPFITGVGLPVDGGRSISAGPDADIAHPDVP